MNKMYQMILSDTFYSFVVCKKYSTSDINTIFNLHFLCHEEVFWNEGAVIELEKNSWKV
jgi:hypothetical protein